MGEEQCAVGIIPGPDLGERDRAVGKVVPGVGRLLKESPNSKRRNKMSHITRIAVSANITDTSLLHKAIEYCKLKYETGGDRIYVTIPNHSWRLVLSKIDGLYSASSESYVASDAQQTMQRIISGYNLAQALQTSEYAAADEI